MPAHEQVDVAVDVEVALIARNLCATESSALTWRVTLEANGAVVEEQTISVGLDREYGVAAFVPSENLMPSTAYRLTVVDEAGELTDEIDFTTGTASVGEVSGDLSASVFDAWWFRQPEKLQEATFQVSVQAVPDAQGLSTVRLLDESGEIIIAAAAADADGSEQDLYGSILGPTARETCVSVEQRDGLGRVVSVVGPLCPVIRRSGCQVGGAPMPWRGSVWGLGALVLLACRRRRD